MARRSYARGQIINKLREAEVLLSQVVVVSGVHAHVRRWIVPGWLK